MVAEPGAADRPPAPRPDRGAAGPRRYRADHGPGRPARRGLTRLHCPAAGGTCPGCSGPGATTPGEAGGICVEAGCPGCVTPGCASCGTPGCAGNGWAGAGPG